MTVGRVIRDLSVDESLGSSDHSIINFVLDMSSSYMKDFVSRKRYYNKADWSLLSNLLANANLDSIFNPEIYTTYG